jgi:CIC family chloride channel protein
MSERALKELLAAHPYRHFPVQIDDMVTGVVRRPEIELALASHRPVQIEPVPTCRPGDTIRGCQSLLIESPTETLVVSDKPEGQALAIVTLHDILRAQVAMSDREGSGAGGWDLWDLWDGWDLCWRQQSTRYLLR